MKSGQEHMPDDAKERESRLRRLLALKRYETPSPGYFEQFPARVMARLEEERPSEAASPLTAWLFGAWRPALAGACLAALALAVGLSLLTVVTLGAFLGSTIPMIFKKLGMDPAVMSNPSLSCTMDILGMLTYFNVVGLVLGL